MIIIDYQTDNKKKAKNYQLCILIILNGLAGLSVQLPFAAFNHKQLLVNEENYFLVADLFGARKTWILFDETICIPTKLTTDHF